MPGKTWVIVSEGRLNPKNPTPPSFSIPPSFSRVVTLLTTIGVYMSYPPNKRLEMAPRVVQPVFQKPTKRIVGRDVMPGEMVVITPEGRLISHQCAAGQTCPCIFEYIYLARPDSVLNDISVYNFQLGLGTRLAQRIRLTPPPPPI